MFREPELHLHANLSVWPIIQGDHIVAGGKLRVHRQLAEVEYLADSAGKVVIQEGPDQGVVVRPAGVLSTFWARWRFGAGFRGGPTARCRPYARCANCRRIVPVGFMMYPLFAMTTMRRLFPCPFRQIKPRMSFSR